MIDCSQRNLDVQSLQNIQVDSTDFLQKKLLTANDYMMGCSRYDNDSTPQSYRCWIKARAACDLGLITHLNGAGWLFENTSSLWLLFLSIGSDAPDSSRCQFDRRRDWVSVVVNSFGNLVDAEHRSDGDPHGVECHVLARTRPEIEEEPKSRDAIHQRARMKRTVSRNRRRRSRSGREPPDGRCTFQA